MRVFEAGDGTATEQPPPTPPPAVPPPPVAAPTPPAPPPPPAEPRNASGETLTQAEAAVLAEVAGGSDGASALARHPLPAGTSTAVALNFLASLPQTTYALDGSAAPVVTGPPVDTLPGFIPFADAAFPDDEGDEADDTEYAEWDDYVDLLEAMLGVPV